MTRKKYHSQTTSTKIKSNSLGNRAELYKQIILNRNCKTSLLFNTTAEPENNRSKLLLGTVYKFQQFITYDVITHTLQQGNRDQIKYSTIEKGI